MKIVKFKDGTYGVRRFSLFFGYVYKDLANSGADFWWPRDSRSFRDCRSSKENAEAFFNIATDKGTKV